MRIIGGKFKGHKLSSFQAEHIRPTTDRVKESLFNIIARDIENARVLDLFSGTGSLGLETLSRGALHVDIVESNVKSITIIRKNLELLKINEGIRIHKADALKYVTEYEGDAYDIILIDPPFPLKICLKILEEISKSSVAGHATRIIIEHSKQEPLPSNIDTLRCIDSRSYGDKLLAFYEKQKEG